MNTEEKKQQIIEYLQTVIDPELHVDIWSMGLVREIDIRAEDSVYIQMTLTSPTCPMGPQIIQDIRDTLAKIGYTTVSVELTFDPPWEPPEDFRIMLGF